MRILISGADGQVGRALRGELADLYDLVPTGRANLDVTEFGSVYQVIKWQPDMVIHAAAWTDVDGCARDPETAFVVNTLGTKHMVLACHHLGIPLVYISTNEVFPGTQREPYYEWDQPGPINPYARSKWAGEQCVQQLLQRFYIVRTAWVFGGPRNFVRTVLRLSDEQPAIRMVTDEWSNPTYAPDLAEAIRALIQSSAYGIYHFVNEGRCSRYELAAEVLRQAGRTGTELVPITLAEYQRSSTPPPSSALHNFVGAHDLGIRLRPWQDALVHYLHTL